MKAYIYNSQKYFEREDVAQIDPLESKAEGREIFIMPANSTEIEPPAEKDGFKIKWSGSEWIYEGIQTEKEEQREKTQEEKAADVRAERDRRIDAIRWRIERYQTQDEAGLETNDTAEQYKAILLYVQALRDVPEQAGFPDAIKWPEEP